MRRGVAASVTMKFDEGLKFERELLPGAGRPEVESAAPRLLRPNAPPARCRTCPPTRPCAASSQAAVIGAGTMGGGIAMNFANAGIPVTILETKQEALDKGLATIRKNYENTIKKGKLTQEKAGPAHRPDHRHPVLRGDQARPTS
jgi:3-hydroxyacyl-CoA dehydrogenase